MNYNFHVYSAKDEQFVAGFRCFDTARGFAVELSETEATSTLVMSSERAVVTRFVCGIEEPKI